MDLDVKVESYQLRIYDRAAFGPGPNPNDNPLIHLKHKKKTPNVALSNPNIAPARFGDKEHSSICQLGWVRLVKE